VTNAHVTMTDMSLKVQASQLSDGTILKALCFSANECFQYYVRRNKQDSVFSKIKCFFFENAK